MRVTGVHDTVQIAGSYALSISTTGLSVTFTMMSMSVASCPHASI